MNAWQDISALILVCLAAASLLRRGWRLFFQPARGCGACGGCASATQANPPAVTSLTLLPDERVRT